MLNNPCSFSVPYTVHIPKKRWKNLPSLQLRHQRLREKLRSLLKELDVDARRQVIPLLRKGGHKTPIVERIPWFPVDCTPDQEAEGDGEDLGSEVTDVDCDSVSASSLPTFIQDLDEKLHKINSLRINRSIKILDYFKSLHLNLLRRSNKHRFYQCPTEDTETNQVEKKEQIKVLQLMIQQLIKSKPHHWKFSVYQLRKRLGQIIDSKQTSSKSILVTCSPDKVVRQLRLKPKMLKSQTNPGQLRINNISKLITKLKNIESSVKYAKKSWMFIPEHGDLMQEYKTYEQKYLLRTSEEELDEALINDEEAIDNIPPPQFSPLQAKSMHDESGESYAFNHNQLDSPDPASADQSMESSPQTDQSSEELSDSTPSQCSENSSYPRRTILTIKPNVKFRPGSVFTSEKTDNKYTFMPSCQTVTETTLRLLTATYALKAQCDNLTLTEKKSAQVENELTLKPGLRSKRKSTTDRTSNFYSGGFNKFMICKREELTLPYNQHPDFELDLENGSTEFEGAFASFNAGTSSKPSEDCSKLDKKKLTKEEKSQLQFQLLDLTFLCKEHINSRRRRTFAAKIVQPLTKAASTPSFQSLARLHRENHDIKTLNWPQFFNPGDCNESGCIKSFVQTNGDAKPEIDISDVTDGVIQTTDFYTDDSPEFNVISEFALRDQFSHTIRGFSPGQDSIPLFPNAVVDHTVELQHHKLELEQRLEQLINDRAPVKLPEYPSKKRLKKEAKRFRSFNPIGTVSIPGANIKTYVNAALCSMLAQVGFTHIQLPALELLAEVLEKHLQNICSNLNEAQEKVAYGAPDGFLDPMDRVLHDLGINGIEGIVQFYKTRVLKYHSVLETDVQNLESKIASGFYHHFKTMSEKSKPKPPIRRGSMSPAYSK